MTETDKVVMVSFGSGGHSSEMLTLVKSANLVEKLHTNEIDRIVCVIGEDDCFTSQRLDAELFTCDLIPRAEKIKIKRARRVGQSYLSSIWTTLASILESFRIIRAHRPQIFITNGPAISVVLSLAIRLMLQQCDIIYIESFCRTKSLSLSGKIMYYLRLANQFYVQWPHLASVYQRSKYVGLLV